ncbi:hypothetical protein Tco_0916581, partial [Tanacetum coccineum]
LSESWQGNKSSYIFKVARCSPITQNNIVKKNSSGNVSEKSRFKFLMANAGAEVFISYSNKPARVHVFAHVDTLGLMFRKGQKVKHMFSKLPRCTKLRKKMVALFGTRVDDMILEHGHVGVNVSDQSGRLQLNNEQLILGQGRDKREAEMFAKKYEDKYKEVS